MILAMVWVAEFCMFVHIEVLSGIRRRQGGVLVGDSQVGRISAMYLVSYGWEEARLNLR